MTKKELEKRVDQLNEELYRERKKVEDSIVLQDQINWAYHGLDLIEFMIYEAYENDTEKDRQYLHVIEDVLNGTRKRIEDQT